MESLINKFTNTYICLCNLFKVKEVETKDKYLKRGVVEKRLRSTGLDVYM